MDNDASKDMDRENPGDREAQLHRSLGRLGAPIHRSEHEAVFTVAESRLLGERIYRDIPVDAAQIADTKNLFLTNRKKTMFWLLTAHQASRVDLKGLGKTLAAAGGLSFGKPALLWEVLRVEPGSVSPLALLASGGDRPPITFLMDQTLWEFPWIAVHPMRNTATVVMPTRALGEWVLQQGVPCGTVALQTAKVRQLWDPAVE